MELLPIFIINIYKLILVSLKSLTILWLSKFLHFPITDVLSARTESAKKYDKGNIYAHKYLS